MVSKIEYWISSTTSEFHFVDCRHSLVQYLVSSLEIAILIFFVILTEAAATKK